MMHLSAAMAAKQKIDQVADDLNTLAGVFAGDPDCADAQAKLDAAVSAVKSVQGAIGLLSQDAGDPEDNPNGE